MPSSRQKLNLLLKVFHQKFHNQLGWYRILLWALGIHLQIRCWLFNVAYARYSSYTFSKLTLKRDMACGAIPRSSFILYILYCITFLTNNIAEWKCASFLEFIKHPSIKSEKIFVGYIFIKHCLSHLYLWFYITHMKRIVSICYSAKSPLYFSVGLHSLALGSMFV